MIKTLDESNLIMTTLKNLFILPDKIPPDANEAKLLEKGRVTEVILKRLLSTKFRKTSMSPLLVEEIKTYVTKTVKDQKPIRIIFLIGGYKLANLSSAPYPDWAEIFNINHMLESARLIESIYPPGVHLIYRADEIFLSLFNNYPPHTLYTYTDYFKKMISLFTRHIPKSRNISISYELCTESAPVDKVLSLMDKLYPKYEKRLNAMSKKEQEACVLKAYRNQCWKGTKDLTKLSENEKWERAQWSFLTVQAFLKAEKTVAKEYFTNGVFVLFRKGFPPALHYGSCSASTVQFWVGQGFIDMYKKYPIPRILSYDQMKTISWETMKVSLPELAELKISTISVIKDALPPTIL